MHRRPDDGRLSRPVQVPRRHGVVSYPYYFYGNPDYLANNRSDCMRLLRGFHEGTLVPGPGN
jgi:hypothetical protein